MAACDDGFVGAGAEFSRTAQGIWGDARGNISSVSLELHAIALPGDAAVSELRAPSPPAIYLAIEPQCVFFGYMHSEVGICSAGWRMEWLES